MSKAHVILLVEDNDDDAFLFDRAVGRAGIDIQVRRANNGQDAIDYLLGVESYSDRQTFPLPDVILLDLKMPICDGFDFLAWKREQPSLICIPTIVMTSSALERDLRRSYELGAQSFTTKVASQDVMSARIAALREWWFKNCVLITPQPA